MKHNVIKFQNVSIVYANGFCAVRDVSFEIAEGASLAIVGESGSGKSTLAKAGLGLLPASAKVTGSILVGETEIVGASEKTLRNLRGLLVGFVAQEPFSAFNPLARVFGHISEAWHVHGLTPPKNLIIDALETFGINEAEKSSQKYPHQWSGGMLQRATIIASSAHHPKLIIADEPTSALDANRADEILTALHSTGSAVLFISHDINLTAKHATRIAVCYHGEIVEIGETRQIVENPKHSYTKILLNAALPRKNLFSPVEERTEIVLEGKNLSRIYGRRENAVRAVSNASLQVRKGEIVGIYGNSGCGKSTLLRLLATIETPSGGEVILGGELAANGETKKLLSRKSRSGFVMPIFQDPLSSLDSRWAIWRCVTEPLMAAHRKNRPARAERRELAREIFAEIGLGEVNPDARPFELSVGQCQRVCIARALVAKPALIVADEPTSALDASRSATILRLLAHIAEKGTAIVIVSHDEPMLKGLCHRVLKMSDGILEN